MASEPAGSEAAAAGSPAAETTTSTADQWVRAQDVHELLSAMNSLRDGDFSVRVEKDHAGVLADVAEAFNQIAARNGHLADELQRVRREVVRRGRLDERVEPSPGAGTWAASVDAVNSTIEALAAPIIGTTRVLDAVAEGDLSRRAELHDGKRRLQGDLRRLGRAANRMTDQLSLFTSELTRVSREVGIEGRLGGHVRAKGLSGEWRMASDDVNTMAAQLTSQVRDIAAVTTAVAQGDLRRQVTVEAAGELLELKLTVNTMVDRLRGFADEVTRVAREVGTEGNLGGQAQVRGVSGVWRDLTDSVNVMAGNLTTQVRNIAQVTTAVAGGDLSQKITVDARGEVLQLKETVNAMVDRLQAFADEVTRVAREVGTEGNLGGQAQVRGVSGVWRDLTDSVNVMAGNLTTQVRNIAQVATAVAEGDLSKKIDVDARGEILTLKNTINTMVDTLSAFSSEVTRVAREVGSEGQLGGQARVEGVYGTWKRLTRAVNELAGNLTAQVRAIAEVARAVTQGDLSRAIDVEARGEVAELKDDINVLVSNLRETTRTKDWLESNLARVASLMHGHRNPVEVAELVLSELTPLVGAQYGAFFLTDAEAPAGRRLRLVAGYGTGPYEPGPGGSEEAGGPRRHGEPGDSGEQGETEAAGEQGEPGEPGAGAGRTDAAQHTGTAREFGESEQPVRGGTGGGLVAEAVKQRRRIVVTDIPSDSITIDFGLGSARPASIVVVPILFEDDVLGVVELASVGTFSDVQLTFVDQFADAIGVSINTIIANARTESLLSESRRLTSELRERSDELQRSNAALVEKAALLETASQYKSEFLANMSHELRTPLNSLLILARLLADNPEGNLSGREVEFADTIHRAGSDLLQLISDILDLSKVEAGRLDVRPRELPLETLLNYVHATFDPLTADKGLEFHTTVAEDVPGHLYSDEQRLQQILRNLLSNAVKFTSAGRVELNVHRVPGEEFEEETLRNADDVIAFAVVDTGIGIAEDKLPAVFDVFRQSGGSTDRQYGGTGLGLSISREMAALLGGRITAESELGVGSRFTLYVPARYAASAAATGLTAAAAGTGTGAATAEATESAEVTAEATGVPEATETAGAAGTAESAGTAGISGAGGPPASAGRKPAPADTAAGAAATPPSAEPAPAAPATPAAPARAGAGTGTPAAPAETWPETTRLKEWLSGRSGRVLKGHRILIVDDDIRSVFAVTQVLGRVGITVTYAENGREGLEALERSPDVSLVLMDIMMPGTDGYEAIRTIRRTPRLAHLPVIALTAKAMPDDRDHALAAGASDYVPKPVDIDRLLSSIVNLLDDGGSSPTGAAAGEPDGGGGGDTAGRADTTGDSTGRRDS